MGKIKECKTCRLIEKAGEINRKVGELVGKRPYVTELKVKPVEILYEGNIMTEKMIYRAKPLNFCPECGREIKREEKVWTD